MKVPVIALLSLLAGVACGQPMRFAERTLNIDTSGVIPQLGLLSNGKFVASLTDGSGTRIYWVTRNDVVQGLRPLAGVYINKMLTIGDEVVVVGRVGMGAAMNTFVGRYGVDGVVRWQAVIDGSSIALGDEAKDVTLGPGNHLYISGNVTNASNNYAYAISLNFATAALRYRTARTTIDRGTNIEATTNGKIHIFGATRYWRTDSNGVTELIAPQPGGVTIGRTRTKGTDVYAVGVKTTTRAFPYLQKRTNLGGLAWERTDFFATGTPGAGFENIFNQIQLDGGGAPYVSGMVSSSVTQWMHILRYSSAGTETADDWFAQFSGESLFSGPLALDQYNHVYYSLRRTAGANGSIGLYKFAPTLPGSTWSTTLQNGAAATLGVHFDTKIHPASGDIIVLQRDGESPSRTIWQVWRQQALPVADSYVVVGATFNSPFSVLANDRFKENAVLELVTSPSKGALSLNPATGNFQYMKNMGASGQDQFVYRLRKNGLVGVATTVTLDL